MRETAVEGPELGLSNLPAPFPGFRGYLSASRGNGPVRAGRSGRFVLPSAPLLCPRRGNGGSGVRSCQRRWAGGWGLRRSVDLQGR